MENIIIGLLLLTSVAGLTVIIERGIALRAGRIIPPAVEAALDGCRAPADWQVLQRICEQHPSPLSRLLLQAGDRRKRELEADVEHHRGTAAEHERRRHEPQKPAVGGPRRKAGEQRDHSRHAGPHN